MVRRTSRLRRVRRLRGVRARGCVGSWPTGGGSGPRGRSATPHPSGSQRGSPTAFTPASRWRNTGSVRLPKTEANNGPPVMRERGPPAPRRRALPSVPPHGVPLGGAPTTLGYRGRSPRALGPRPATGLEALAVEGRGLGVPAGRTMGGLPGPPRAGAHLPGPRDALGLEGRCVAGVARGQEPGAPGPGP